ncbi:hypothetical protein ACFLTX_00090 [Chloroflexota bacterium]
MDEILLYQTILNILSDHIGRRNRAEKWKLIETVFSVEIPKNKRNQNNFYDRRFRSAISTMRHNGLLVGSDCSGGYWLMDDINEVITVADQLRRRAKNLLHSASKLESTGLSVFGSQRRLL